MAYTAPSRTSGRAPKRNILCFLGFHKWKRSGGLNVYSSNVREKYFVCTGCGKKKTVYEPKKD